MNYSLAYQKLSGNRSISDGLRITFGILFPSLLLGYFNELTTGIVCSVGALCVSVTDIPGPVHHRYNGMWVCILLTGLVALLISYCQPHPALLVFMIALLGFIFSMLTIYGARSTNIGVAALLIMILNLQNTLTGIEIWKHAACITAGGSWYMLFSLSLYQIRPFKTIQQITGDLLSNIAEYLTTRAEFFSPGYDEEKAHQQLLKQQIDIQTQQTMLSELLFKTRAIAKESTHTGRVLLKMFLDLSDIFESIMASQQNYEQLHDTFADSNIILSIHDIIVDLSSEMKSIALAIQSGTASTPTDEINNKITSLRNHFESLRQTFLHRENIEAFITLGRIIDNIEGLGDKITLLHNYSTYDKKIKRSERNEIDKRNFVSSQDIRPSMFFNNLGLSSNSFRHALRVSLSLLAGYLISLKIHVGHSYWILLTIVVILKPAYSLTKKRNKDRLIGTFLGIIAGVILLYFIHNNTILFFIMVVLMSLSYIFIRNNYFFGVLFMTPYLVIFFHLINPNNLQSLLTDRIWDTVIGSAIAFLASILLVPTWENATIASLMTKMMEANKKYYQLIAGTYAQLKVFTPAELRKTRKDVLVALANLSDAFNRMLSEPKWIQKNITEVHRFVVLNHLLTSHISTLSYYLNKNNFRSDALVPLMECTLSEIDHSIQLLNNKETTIFVKNSGLIKPLNEQLQLLTEKRKEELANRQMETPTKKLLTDSKSAIDQFLYIESITNDILKQCLEKPEFS